MKVHLGSGVSFAFLPRMFVAIVLILAFLTGTVPLSYASTGSLCTMECCVSLAPHAAGSCHMDPSVHAHHTGSTGPVQPSEADTGVIKGLSASVMGMTANANSS